MTNDEWVVRHAVNRMSSNPIVDKSFELAKLVIRLHGAIVE